MRGKENTMEEAVLLEKARVLLRRIYTEGAPM